MSTIPPAPSQIQPNTMTDRTFPARTESKKFRMAMAAVVVLAGVLAFSGAPASALSCASPTRYGVVSKSKSESNAFSGALWTAKLSTSLQFCWNGSRVTSVGVTLTPRGTAMPLGQVYWRGTDARQGQYYTYNGHYNGGYKYYVKGAFDICVLKYGCVKRVTLDIWVYAHYDGTVYSV